MPRLDWYAFYVADYRADTRHLSREQHFAYREMLDEIFLAGQHELPASIPDDDEYLKGLARASSPEEWSTTRHVLIDGPRAFLLSSGGRITQKRMAHEVDKALQRSSKAKTAAGSRWDKAKADIRPQSGTEDGHMTASQFNHYRTMIDDWNDSVPLTVGDSAFDAAFRARFGFSFDRWDAECMHHGIDLAKD